MVDFAREAENYRKEFVTLLEQWVNIPSVYQEKTVSSGMPFGQAVAQALEWFKNMGAAAGFTSKSVDGYAAHIEYGKGEEYVYVFGHCDVVPAGEGWNSDPFKLLKYGDRLVGRGVIDDKGPLLAAFLALKLIRDKALPVKRTFRIVAGGNEEGGFKCIKYYFQQEPKPTYGFTPDAKFPVLHGERGGLVLQISGEIENKAMCVLAGAVHNTIPDHAMVANCVLGREMIEKFAQEEGVTVEYDQEGDNGTGFKLIGCAGHSSKPEKANNPIEKVFALFARTVNERRLKAIAKVLDGGNRDGGLFGIDGKGRCGTLTIVPTILRVEDGRLNLILSVRYPENLEVEQFLARVGGYFMQNGLNDFEVQVLDNKKPYYMEPDAPLVRTLYEIYVKHTGDRDNPIRVTNGGTYAAEMANSVVFGGEFPDGSAGNVHLAGEYGSEDAFVKAIGIYAEALWQLGNLSDD